MFPSREKNIFKNVSKGDGSIHNRPVAEIIRTVPFATFYFFCFALASSSSRRTLRRILPTADLGIESRNSISLGTL